jgi:hypothetical protein
MKKSEKELRTAISKEEMIRVANEYFDLDDSAIQYLQSH